MKAWLSTIILVGILALDGSAAGIGPEVTYVDQKISISADDITLERLLRLWDQATAMQSVVPPDLAGRKLSVHFTGLAVSDALRKMFDGQPFDYVLVQEHGILVMDRSQSVPVAQAAADSQAAAASNDVEQVVEPPVAEEPPSLIVPPPDQQQPFIIQTPFGPMFSPYGREQPVVQLPPVYGPPPPPFFAINVPPVPPAGAPNGPVQNTLFGPLPVYHDPIYVASRP
jgi:hypothetical protein